MAKAPSPRRGADSTLECLFYGHAGPRRDVRPAGSVIPVAVNPVRPSPPLPHHAGHYDDIPTLLERAGTRHRHDCHYAAYGSPVNGTLESAHGRRPNDQPLRRHPRDRSCMSTGRTTTPRLGRIRQDGRQFRGTARHGSTRTKIVRHTCKLLPPWPIKGGAVLQPRGHGTTGSDHPHALRLHHDIGTCLNQYLWDMEAWPPLPPRL
jgi:hypothetical protein